MRKVILIALVLVLASGHVWASEKVLMLRFRGVGVDEELVDAVMLVFQGALEQEGEYLPVGANDMHGGADCYDVSCASSLAREAGYAKAVTGSLTRLGYKLITRVQLVDAAGESVVFSDDGVSTTEEDLDIVLKRLAVAISTGRTMESTAEVGLITDQEFEAPRRRTSYSSKSLRAGFMWPTSGTLGGDIRLIVLDLAYQYDTEDFFLTGCSGFRWGGGIDEEGGRGIDIALLDAKIGKYFSRSDVAPFVSAGLGVHWVKAEQNVSRREGSAIITVTEEDSGTGLALFLGGGLSLFRTYDFQFQLNAEFIYILEDLKVGGNPQGFILTFCIKRGKRSE